MNDVYVRELLEPPETIQGQASQAGTVFRISSTF